PMPFLSRSLLPCRSMRLRGIVARMSLFFAIRVAEPWTTASMIVLVALVAIVVGLTFWLIHRY
ncbi:MAG: hypothetical protein ACR2NG_00965, partial [Acidimicrobiia bacterium]